MTRESFAVIIFKPASKKDKTSNAVVTQGLVLKQSRLSLLLRALIVPWFFRCSESPQAATEKR